MNTTQEFGEMFERFARDFFSPQLDSEDFGFRPNVDVEETDNGYRVTVELAGIKEEHLTLSLKDNSLVIEGKREERKGFFRFYRTVPLRDDVDDKNIQASFINGVLSVDLVKRADGIEKTRKIPINKH